MNRVIRIPRTKNNLAHAVPLNDTAYATLQRLYAARDLELDSEYIFVHHRDARHTGKPVLDVKNGFHTALKDAAIDNFTWHDFRHDYASRLVMAGAASVPSLNCSATAGYAWSCGTSTSRRAT